MSAGIRGQRVVLTGRLSSMTRKEAADLIREHGGEFASSVSGSTDLLVVGREGWPINVRGELSRKLRRARELIESGATIRVEDEDEFLGRLGLAPESHLYTVTQLSRILGVPGARIRSWVRNGLVTPAASSHRLDTFDFREVTSAKKVAELVASGVGPGRIRASLDALAGWHCDVESPLRALAVLQESKRILVRFDDGRLSEPGGQLLLDFGTESSGRDVIASSGPSAATDWFTVGIRREETGDLEGAARAYEAALGESGPGSDPEVLFNLGNVHYGLDRKEEAAARFAMAVELDPTYAEALNNLGNVQADLGRTEEAVRTLTRALALVPDYADAHFNLAETLTAAGRPDRARPHWLAYLATDDRSDWADHARRRLGEG